VDAPRQLEPIAVGDDTFALPGYLPLPGLGELPATSFLIRGREPVLIDTGIGALRNELVADLERLVDLDDIRWIWLTHTDHDHLGALPLLLDAAPRARIVTTFLGVGKMGLHSPLPHERVYLLNPGQTLRAGDRELVAVRPPVFDAPETVAAFDTGTRTLFAADCFGSLLTAPSERADAIAGEELIAGMTTWARIDAPWLEHVAPANLDRAIDHFRRLAPETVCSAHLPPARGMLDVLARQLLSVCGEPGFVGPDQAALEAMETMKAPA
jgi:flavorubredoxin